ncbi:MAG: FtsX-like permease family protein [Acidobacteria bacterium]|nr:FtsX-like permease family protein [Acidobacteriota bacterium]
MSAGTVIRSTSPQRPGLRLYLRLAWRNVWRNPRRTLLTLSAVAFAAVILVFMVSMQLGGYGAMIRGATGVFTGDLQVQAEGYHAKQRLRTAIADASSVEARVAAVPGVTAVSSRAQAFALVSSATRTYGGMIVGVDPAKEPSVSTIPRTIRKGRYLSGATSDEAVVGQALASNLSLTVGDEITVLGQGLDGSLAVAVLKVVGIFSSGVPELDRQTVEMPLASFQSAFLLGDRVHAIVVRTGGLEAVPHVAGLIRAAIANRPGLTVLRWDQLLEGLKQGIAMDAAVGWFLYTALVLVVTFSILNTFLMSVLERTREFGVFLALGTRPRILGRVVILESVILLLLGLAIGTLAGAGITAYAGVHGIAFSSSEELLAQWSLPARIYPRLDLLSVTLGPAAILLATLVAALFPARRIRRLRPVDAMKAV